MAYRQITFKDFEGKVVTCNVETAGKRYQCYLDYFRCGECKNQIPSDDGICHSFYNGSGVDITYDETEQKRYCKKYEKQLFNQTK